MKVGISSFALLALISTWDLSGCSTNEPFTTTQRDIDKKEAEKANEYAEHSHAKTAGHQGEGRSLISIAT